MKSQFSEKINRIDKPPARLTKKNKKKTQITNIKKERGGNTTDPTDTEVDNKEFCEQFYAHKSKNSEIRDKLFKSNKLSKFTQVERNNLNNLKFISRNQIHS